MRRIVIVDDSETARMFQRRCLEIAGCQGDQFVEAASGEEAMAALNAGPTDLLVTDLVMSGLGGEELLRRLRADPRWRDLPVLVITSVHNPAREQELCALGATAVLAKPVSPLIMAKTLKALGGWGGKGK